MSRKMLLPGIFFFLLGGLMMSLQAVCIRFMSGHLALSLQVAGRFIICLLIGFVILMVKSPKEGRFTMNRKGLLFLRSIVAFCALCIVFYTIPLYNSGIVYVIFFSSPVFIPLVARLWLHIPIVHKLWVGISIATVGLVLIVAPSGAQVHLGMLLIVLGAVLGAFSSISIRVLHKTDSTHIITWSYFIVSTIGSFVLIALTDGPLVISYERSAFIALIGAGIVGYLFQYFVTHGMKYAPSRVLSPFLYASSIFSLLIDALFFQSKPSLIDGIGIALIIIGTALNVFLFPKDQITHLGKSK